jgi:hypothetical protein
MARFVVDTLTRAGPIPQMMDVASAANAPDLNKSA